MVATGVLLDPYFGSVINETDVPTERVMGEAARLNPLIASIAKWTAETQGTSARSRNGGLLDRDRYVTPENIYEQMRLAHHAVENDDVVSGVLESTESLAFSKVSFYAEDEDEEDVYNQIAADIDLDSRLREMWRELFTTSQFYAAVWWHTKTYKVRGRNTETGVKRKKEFTLRVPKAITLLDPLKIVPVGNPMFNQEKLAYIADRDEDSVFGEVMTGPRGTDPIIERLIVGKYEPDRKERSWLGELGVAPDRLYLLNPATVFRHSATRPQFQRFASVRMKSVFELLDQKQQLRQMDRAHLIGGTNFIVLITKGSDDHPAKPEEIRNLQDSVRVIARVPIMIGDHRLKVEIITPKLDSTLRPERYNTIDSRITGRLYQMFVLGNYSAGSGNDDSAKLVKVIARGMESRRHMLRRTLEVAIFDPIFEKNDTLETAPKLRYHPKNIALDFDPNWASFLLDLRAARELSRETLLSQMDMDQGDEAAMLQREAEKYDDIFMTQVPFTAPNGTPSGGPGGPPGAPGGGPPNAPGPGGGGAPGTTPPPAGPMPGSPAELKRQGRTGGGNRNGGGRAPGTGQGQPPKNVRRKSK
jgi:hypothetical protein